MWCIPQVDAEYVARMEDVTSMPKRLIRTVTSLQVFRQAFLAHHKPASIPASIMKAEIVTAIAKALPA